MTLPSPFVSGNQTAGFVPAGSLDAMLKDRLSKSKFKQAFLHMGIALADLTGIGEDPDPGLSFSIVSGANTNLETETAVGSLSKIAPMFAAFRLRERVGLAAAAVGSNAKDSDEVVENITSEWKPLVSKRISKPPQDFPNLKHMFDFSSAPPWNPTFKDGKKGWSSLDGYHEKPTAATLEFTERMKLMVRWSDNLAAGTCARDVGFQYMNASLADDGFAENRRNGILWLGGDFGFTNTPPIMGPPPWDNRGDATWVRANAKGILSFFTLLWTNRLVNKESSRAMRDILLERPGLGLTTDLVLNTPNVVRAFSKVGILATTSEGVIIESNTGSGLIRYAGVGLGALQDDVMKELAGIFYDCIEALH
jgi:hypothetical protein